VRVLEQRAHPGGAHPDVLLHEVRAGHLEERHSGLPRHGPGEQRLAGARRADEESARGRPGAEGGEARPAPEEPAQLLHLRHRLPRAAMSVRRVAGTSTCRVRRARSPCWVSMTTTSSPSSSTSTTGPSTSRNETPGGEATSVSTPALSSASVRVPP